jgi:hypothetical protein
MSLFCVRLHEIFSLKEVTKPLHNFYLFYVILANTHGHYVGCVLKETFCVFKQKILKC